MAAGRIPYGFRRWLHSLSDDELRTYRYELYDITEIADPADPMYEFAEAAVAIVDEIERRRTFVRTLGGAIEVRHVPCSRGGTPA